MNNQIIANTPASLTSSVSSQITRNTSSSPATRQSIHSAAIHRHINAAKFQSPVNTPFMNSGVNFTGVPPSSLFDRTEEDENGDLDPVIAYAKTMTVEASARLDKTYQSKINGTDIGDVKTFDGQGGGKMQIEEIGRLIHESTMSLIKGCGDVFHHVVQKNVDVQKCSTSLSQKLQELNSDISLMENSILTSPERLPETYFKSKANVMIEGKKKFLYYHYLMKNYADKLNSGIVESTDPAFVAWGKEEIDLWDDQSWNVYTIIEDVTFDPTNAASLRGAKDSFKAYEKYFDKPSSLYDKYLGDVEIIKQTIESQMHQDYFNHIQEHQKEMNKINQLKENLSNKKNIVQDLTVLSNIHIAFSTAIMLIVGKVKQSVRNYPEIVSKLQCRVILSETNQVVENPFEKNSLSGLMEILRSEFVKANLVQFKHKLLDVLNFRLSKTQMEGSPFHGVQAITQKINVWKSMNLFSYLNEDIFWTVSYLRMYNTDTEIYQKALSHSMEFIHRVTTY